MPLNEERLFVLLENILDRLDTLIDLELDEDDLYEGLDETED